MGDHIDRFFDSGTVERGGWIQAPQNIDAEAAVNILCLSRDSNAGGKVRLFCAGEIGKRKKR